jgi:hypothetical protein
LLPIGDLHNHIILFLFPWNVRDTSSTNA